MNKKILSAVLFGALMATSAGTFVSCKDYDDDIDNLQTQIDGLDSALKAIEAKVNEGKWVSSLASTDNGFTVTFSDGSSYTIENGKDGEPGTPGAPGEAGKDGNIAEVREDGYWYFNGVKSDYVGVKKDDLTGKVNLPEVREDGYWYFYNEETKEMEKSEYKAAGAAYAVYADGKYTLYMPDANGEMLPPIELPTAAAKITSLAFTAAQPILNTYQTIWDFTPSENIQVASAWEGTKTLPANGTGIYGATTKLLVQVNPAELDVVKEGIKFSLINGKNELALAKFALALESYEGNVKPDGTPVTRAAANGLYNISLNPQTIAKADLQAVDNALNAANRGQIGYALNAGNAFRSPYSITVNTGTTLPVLRELTINGKEAQIGGATTQSISDIKVGDTYEVTFNDDAALYDTYFVVEKRYEDAFGIVIDNEKRTILVGHNTDVSSLDAEFPMTVYTADINGVIKETELIIKLSHIISGDQVLDAQNVNVAVQNPNFKFAVSDVDASSTSTWLLNVDLNNVAYKLYKDAECKDEISNAIGNANLFKGSIVNVDGDATADVSKAKDVKFAINNTYAATVGLTLNTTYYVKVTFNSKDNKELNSVVLPVTFTAPALASLYEIKDGYVKDGAINAYFTTASTNKEVSLNEYFVKAADAKLSLDTQTKIGDTKKNSSELAKFTVTTPVEVADAKLTFNAGTKPNSQFEWGYGETLIVNAVKDNYAGWKYKTDAEKVYSFKIKMMSPIVEGTVKGADGKTISIKANDALAGAPITADMIKGYDYNNNVYNVVPDEYDEGNAAWATKQIKSVVPGQDKNKYIEIPQVVAASQDSKGNTVYGYFKVTAKPLSKTLTVKMPVKVTDMWGYTLTKDVDVEIVVGE